MPPYLTVSFVCIWCKFLFTNSYGFHIDSFHDDFVFQHTSTNAACFFLTYISVCVLGIVCVCMFVCVVYVWRSEVNIGHFPRLLSTLIFKASSLAKSRAHHFTNLDGQWAMRIHMFPTHTPILGLYIYMHITMLAFYVGAGIQIRYLGVVWQEVY